MKTMKLVVAFIALLVMSPVAKAEMILQLGTGGSVSGISTSFTAAAGTQLQLDVWLTQRGVFSLLGTPVGDYRLSNDGALQQTGLNSFTLDVVSANPNSTFALNGFNYGNGFNATTSTTTRPGGVGANGLQVNGFSNETTTGSAIASPVYVTEPHRNPFTVINAPNTGTVAANSIRLGTVTLNVAADAAAPFQLTASSPFTGAVNDSQYFGTGSSYINPSFFFGPNSVTATINVSAVPEPTTWLFGTVLCGFGARRLRKRFARKTSIG